MELINGDLFEYSDECVMVHCVSQDFYMNRGIALTFKKKFNNVGYLLSLNKKVGQVAILEQDKFKIGYLITKEHYYGKPTYESLTEALYDLLRFYKDSNLSCPIIMPRIGCGLDKLNWDRVKKIIEDIFVDIRVIVFVY